MTHASLCTGIGACELAASWLGWDNAFSCEINSFCQHVLKYYYPKSKHYENIFGTDFTEWRGRIDVLTAGFPCQPFSCAGSRKGAEDDRYLWPEVLRVIGEVMPTWFVGENVAGITSMVLPGDELEVGSYKDIFDESYTETEVHQQFVVERICNDLERIGYSVQPIVIPACAVGAPHRRDRIWFVANRTDSGFESVQQKRQDGIYKFSSITNTDRELLADGDDQRTERRGKQNITIGPFDFSNCWGKFPTQSPVCGGDDGIPDRLSDITVSRWITESTKAYGNSMVPQVVYQIFKFIEEIEKNFNF